MKKTSLFLDIIPVVPSQNPTSKIFYYDFVYGKDYEKIRKQREEKLKRLLE